MPRRILSKSHRQQNRTKRINQVVQKTKKIPVCRLNTNKPKFSPHIDSEKDFFGGKYQNVVRSYQNIVAKKAYSDKSQEELRWIYHQNESLMTSFCENFQNTHLSPVKTELKTTNNEENLWNSDELAKISEPFGHVLLFDQIEPMLESFEIPFFDSLVFSEGSEVHSFYDLVIKNGSNEI